MTTIAKTKRKVFTFEYPLEVFTSDDKEMALTQMKYEVDVVIEKDDEGFYCPEIVGMQMVYRGESTKLPASLYDLGYDLINDEFDPYDWHDMATNQNHEI